MTKEVSREVTEHAMLIGQLQTAVKSVEKSADEIKGTHKEIFDKIDRTEKYLAGKIEGTHCKKEEVLKDHEVRIEKVETDLAPIVTAKTGAAFSVKSITILWNVITALIVFYIAIMTYINSMHTP